jgi:RecB family endonuclease NucS
MNNQNNWVKIYGHYANERSISDYIANYPYLLEDGLTQYPSSKVREKIFDDRTRLDVLLIDKNEVPVIVECKQQEPTRDNIKQLLHYLKKLTEETDKAPRGIIVHGGSAKLSPEVKEFLIKFDNIEIVSYRADVEFIRSN